MKKLDFILVHGHDLEPDGSLDVILTDRLDSALSLFKEDYAHNIIVAGKHGKTDKSLYESTKVTMSRCMKEYLVLRDVERIFEEPEGTNTFDCSKNAYEEIIKPRGWNSGWIISSAEHLPRIILQNSKIFPPRMMLFYHGPLIQDPNRSRQFLAHERKGIAYTLERDD